VQPETRQSRSRRLDACFEGTPLTDIVSRVCGFRRRRIRGPKDSSLRKGSANWFFSNRAIGEKSCADHRFRIEDSYCLDRFPFQSVDSLCRRAPYTRPSRAWAGNENAKGIEG
jgi:hypothetical protein